MPTMPMDMSEIDIYGKKSGNEANMILNSKETLLRKMSTNVSYDFNN